MSEINRSHEEENTIKEILYLFFTRKIHPQAAYDLLNSIAKDTPVSNAIIARDSMAIVCEAMKRMSNE